MSLSNTTRSGDAAAVAAQRVDLAGGQQRADLDPQASRIDDGRAGTRPPDEDRGWELVIVTARACLVPLRPTGAGSYSGLRRNLSDVTTRNGRAEISPVPPCAPRRAAPADPRPNCWTPPSGLRPRGPARRLGRGDRRRGRLLPRRHLRPLRRQEDVFLMQWYAGPNVPSMLDLAPGDLVFYATDTNDPSTIHRMGMYVGGGLMIEGPYTGRWCASARSTVRLHRDRPARRLSGPELLPRGRSGEDAVGLPWTLLTPVTDPDPNDTVSSTGYHSPGDLRDDCRGQAATLHQPRWLASRKVQRACGPPRAQIRRGGRLDMAAGPRRRRPAEPQTTCRHRALTRSSPRAARTSQAHSRARWKARTGSSAATERLRSVSVQSTM